MYEKQDDVGYTNTKGTCTIHVRVVQESRRKVCRHVAKPVPALSALLLY